MTKKNDLKEEVKKDLEEAGFLATGKKEPAQKPLFGDMDLVINTLETEATEIKKQIEKAQDSIDRRKEEISDLGERLDNIETSLAKLRAKAKEVEAPAEEKEGEPPF